MIWVRQLSRYGIVLMKNEFIKILFPKITDLIAGVAPLSPGEQTRYSTYSGSLTTPGCMEIVNWINFIKPIKISKKQLEEFRKLKDKGNDELVDNFRPVQPLNGRPVTFYGV